MHFIETHAAPDAEEAGTISTVGNHAVVEQFYRQLPVDGDGGDGERGFTRDGFRAALEHINGAKLIRWHTDELFAIADENGDGVVTAHEFADVTAGTLDAKISEHPGRPTARASVATSCTAAAVVSMAAMIQTDHGARRTREPQPRRRRADAAARGAGASERPEKPQSLAANLKRRDHPVDLRLFRHGGEGSISDEMVAFTRIGLGGEDDLKLDALDGDNSGGVSFEEFIESSTRCRPRRVKA